MKKVKLVPAVIQGSSLSCEPLVDLSVFARKSKTSFNFVHFSLSRLSIATLGFKDFRRWILKPLASHFDYLYVSVSANRMNQ